MKKEKRKQSAIVNSPIQCICEIDYEKLATAIVKAEKQISDDNPVAPSTDNSSTLKRIFQIVRGKRDTKTTFTVGLFSLILSLFCRVISFLIGIFSVAGVVYAFSSIPWTSATIVSNTISIIFALMLFLMGIMLTLIFHVVSVEMEKTNDKNVIFQAFSGMASLVALIVALVALYK